MTNEIGSTDIAVAGAVMAPALEGEILRAPRGRFVVECVGPDGQVKWVDGFENVVCKDGKILALDILFGATAKPTWYMILKAGALGGTAAADSVTSHAGWTEYQNYTNATRPQISFGSAAVANTTGATITHASNTPVSFTINGGGGTVSGCGAVTHNVKGNNTTGTLYNVGDFTAARTVSDGDTLNVTLTLTLAA